MTISYADFEQVEVRVGEIISAEAFPEARQAAYKLTINFGDKIGIKRSSAQITENYNLTELPGKLILAVVNLGPKQIGPFMSECLTLGFRDQTGAVVLASPTSPVPLGSKMF